MSESLMDLVSKKVKDAVDRCPTFLMESDEDDLARELKLNATDRLIRTSFWREYGIIMKRGWGKIDLVNICRGVCTTGLFYKRLQNDVWVAWLMKPMREFDIESEALLSVGMAKMWDLMNMELVDGEGNVDTKKGALFLSAFKEIKDTVKGKAIQKIEQKNTVEGKIYHDMDEKAINKRLREAESSLKKSPFEIEEIVDGEFIAAGEVCEEGVS